MVFQHTFNFCQATSSPRPRETDALMAYRRATSETSSSSSGTVALTDFYWGADSGAGAHDQRAPSEEPQGPPPPIPERGDQQATEAQEQGPEGDKVEAAGEGTGTAAAAQPPNAWRAPWEEPRRDLHRGGPVCQRCRAHRPRRRLPCPWCSRQIGRGCPAPEGPCWNAERGCCVDCAGRGGGLTGWRPRQAVLLRRGELPEGRSQQRGGDREAGSGHGDARGQVQEH